jgi:hypothetical protein
MKPRAVSSSRSCASGGGRSSGFGLVGVDDHTDEKSDAGRSVAVEPGSELREAARRPRMRKLSPSI